MVSRAFNPKCKISKEKRQVVLEAAKKHNFSPNRLASRLSMRTVRIGIVINTRFSAGTTQMLKGIEAAYENLKDYKIEYHIQKFNPDINNLQDYKDFFSQHKNFDAIILAGMSSSRYTPVINELYKDVPCIAQVQAVNTKADYLFGSKHNEQTASCLAADFLSSCLKRNCRKNILLFTGDLDSSLHSSAKEAFTETAATYGLNVLDCIDMKDNVDYFEKIIPEVFAKYNDNLDGIYITSGFSEPLCKYLDENKSNSALVTFDTLEHIKKYLEKGVIDATISQNISRQMETAFEILVKHLITGEIPPKTVYTDLQVVLKSNIHQYNG